MLSMNVESTPRLEAEEKYVQELPTPDKTYYKPEGQDECLNIKGNYD